MMLSGEDNVIVPTEILREKIRNFSRDNRDKNRDFDRDSLRFGLGEIQVKIAELDNLTEKDVTGLASRIKRRKHATAEDMYRLSHSFLQGIENIRAFAKIPGAIQTLVKELTGKDSNQQIYASETLCNLSLGESHVCEKIASIAGSYLITYLDATEERLKRTSLWTLANILGTSGKGAETMLYMEIVPKLWALYTATEDASCSGKDQDDYREDAAICLHLIASNTEKLKRPEDQKMIFEKMCTKNPSSPGSEYHLQIIFDMDVLRPGNPITENQVNYLMNFALANLSNDFDTPANRLRIIYAVRIIANLLVLHFESFDVLVKQATVWNTNIVKLLNKVFALRNELLTNEAFWLLKNITACQNNNFPASDFLEHLQIPTGSLPAEKKSNQLEVMVP